MKTTWLVTFVGCYCVFTVLAANVPGYRLESITKTNTGYKGILSLIDGSHGPYGDDISPLQLDVRFETWERLHVKISAPGRWEVPDVVVDKKSSITSGNYIFTWTENPFGFAVLRSEDRVVLFNTTPTAENGFNGLIFEDMYLEISTSLPQNPNIYGLGERVYPLKLPLSRTYTIWTRDNGTPELYNLYGAHPFYLEMRDTKAHGVFLLNSNGMDVILNHGSLTYQVMGGVLDFYFFIGPEPNMVVQQYQELIGRPALPPYWALGYHQSRVGWYTVNVTRGVYERLKEDRFPVEAMWNDLDYMDNLMNFVFDPIRYPVREVKAFVNELHNDGVRYVIIADPSIKIQKGYLPYDTGMKENIFVLAPGNTSQPLRGMLWGKNPSYFPDFSHPRASDWWTLNVRAFHDQAPFDGLWIDMNVPTMTCSGQCVNEQSTFSLPDRRNLATLSTSLSSLTNEVTESRYSPFNPPWKPWGIRDINEGTFNMSARTYRSIVYNTHNMYGFYEAKVSFEAMTRIRKLRPFVLSRSTFPGSGRYAAHWLGDNLSDWHDLRYSIPGILAFSLFGIPLVGADICGFLGNVTVELCIRWMQAGAFYPFCRNHNAGAPHEPFVFGKEAEGIMANAIRIRYALLPYIYTQFYIATNFGMTVARPLFFEFPWDETTWDVDKQWLLGPAIYVTPVLEPNVTEVVGYFPNARWYDLYNGTLLNPQGAGWYTLDAPLSKINVHVRGGFIVPLQVPDVTTEKSRRNPFVLLVALDEIGSAQGSVYIDDGETLQDHIGDHYTLITYSSLTINGQSKISSGIINGNYSIPNGEFVLTWVRVYGCLHAITSVKLNGESYSHWTYDRKTNVLDIVQLNWSMLQDFSIVIS